MICIIRWTAGVKVVNIDLRFAHPTAVPARICCFRQRPSLDRSITESRRLCYRADTLSLLTSEGIVRQGSHLRSYALTMGQLRCTSKKAVSLKVVTSCIVCRKETWIFASVVILVDARKWR